MDPIPIAVITQPIVTPKNGFLACAAFQAMGLHSREVNSHSVFVTPWGGPTAFGRISVLECVASRVPRRRPVGSAPRVRWENSGEQHRKDRSARGETSTYDADIFFNNGPEWGGNIILPDMSAAVYNSGVGWCIGLTSRIRACWWEIKGLHSEDTRDHDTVGISN